MDSNEPVEVDFSVNLMTYYDLSLPVDRVNYFPFCLVSAAFPVLTKLPHVPFMPPMIWFRPRHHTSASGVIVLASLSDSAKRLGKRT